MLPDLTVGLMILFASDFSAQLDFVGRRRIVDHLERRFPLQSLDAAGSGIVIAAINESERAMESIGAGAGVCAESKLNLQRKAQPLALFVRIHRSGAEAVRAI